MAVDWEEVYRVQDAVFLARTQGEDKNNHIAMPLYRALVRRIHEENTITPEEAVIVTRLIHHSAPEREQEPFIHYLVRSVSTETLELLYQYGRNPSDPKFDDLFCDGFKWDIGKYVLQGGFRWTSDYALDEEYGKKLLLEAARRFGESGGRSNPEYVYIPLPPPIPKKSGLSALWQMILASLLRK